ncbi:ABC transporter ATP-binding protein [Candidatus Thioglobus sp.]|jgi:putative ABC transport system ATP-binding protein|nr:ABC transporter ATP-binding protein [Candidatus Thioglobus sp.]MDA8872149.1 ABC transporter ATP-binding protein [Candidatus Thioglobus sp.]MDB4026375.1 ABC transporter ATP-binding protein [Candidatus Thioglobus sp.]MDB4056887.1 ABC transporter ATP-binding protein [Candidatus Thioglobus sp.]MDB4139915.1 ABC transporter ATP-binding protein [Candidatus Thioglobus sp.]MDB9865483.1 ABC transporter ATP-binding protein [Candidatus Thioglobus sp.]|tara:strand:- start:515 stop:1180 length:666 start_codon:yes stop_codon:yes gene_type:complete
MSEAIQFNNVSLNYGSKNDVVEVLKRINFSVNSEEIISIVGPSGSGKTSIIMLASGLETATEGSIKINNEEIVGLKEDKLSEVRRKNIGIVFQSFYLIPNLTAIENVLLSLEANQKYNQDDDAKALLADFGLYHRLNHLPSELSGGEQQRVAIARALINKPKIILADEPTGNLDSANSESMMDLLFNYTKKSKTSLVMVTHDNSIAERCDRIIEIKDGQIV